MAPLDPDLLQASPADYRLLRLVLIDSYSPGRVVEFPVDGGAVLTGRNGRGKTTLLQLVPIFYGENPARIVGTETNRLDFNGYYLPRLTSYIVFEYLRRDVPCLVVLHASQSGGERRYRFVRSTYRPDLFLLPDGTNILQATDLRRHFKLKGVLHSEALSSVSEYRGVIQGKVGSGKAAQRLRALAADYAYVGPGHHLTHMEKIVSGMFLRRTDFQDLQRMVVSCISEGDAEIARDTGRDKIASWPEHYAAYTRAMDQAAVKAREAEQAQARQAIEAEREQALAAHDRERDQARARHAEAGTAIQAERDQALGAAGVDTAALNRLEQEMTTAQTQLQAIARSRDEVGQWHLWQRNDWPRREEYGRAAQAARDQVVAARADQAAEEKRWKALRAELDAVLKDLDRRHTRLEQELAAVRGRLDGFRAYAPDPEVMGQPFEPGWVLEALTQQANGNQAEAVALGQAIGRLIERIKRAFSEQRDTPPDQFYESHRADLGPDASPRAWVPVFRSWFDGAHDDNRRTLAVEANQIAGAIVAFHRDMDAFHRQVLQFNRELQQSLDENLGFESVSRVTVEIKSVIRELEYWQPIEAMAEEHRAWLQLQGQGLPPPEFAATLRALLGHWEVREGIRAALPSLIRIQGEVVENGQTRVFRKAADLERVSSNGL